VGPIFATTNPIQVGTPINFSAIFTDPGVLDIHTAIWDWDVGNSTPSTSPGTVTESNGSGSVNDTHTYNEAGVYEVELIVTDKDLDSGSSNYSILVYDPSAGFITGGGWIDSPAGSYKPDPLLTGKASFGFVSKYKKGTEVPDGNTEFQFKAGDLNFHSDHYKWLIVTGSESAKFMGEGTINGAGINGDLYHFQIWVCDKDPDTIHIRVWYENEYGEEVDVYDNGADQEIGGGSIVIHSKK
jgi:hypothetical protein